MSDAVQIELVRAIPSLVAAIAASFAAYLAYRTKDIAARTEVNTNHMKDELVAEVRKAEFAAGQKDQKEGNK